MKIYLAFLILIFCSFSLPAQEIKKEPLFDWDLLWSGSWSGKTLASGNLFNRTEVKLSFLPLGLALRGQVLDRRPLSFEQETPIKPEEQNFQNFVTDWLSAQDFDKAVTHFQGGLYHKQTGSRILIGALDEWGLSARIRNPWIRSAPFSNNHKPLITDLKTAVSAAKQDEVYAYLSTPYLNLFPNIRTRAFVSAQTEIGLNDDSKYRQTASSAGIDFALPNKSLLLLETFYTSALLPPTKNSTWFSDPMPLPQRDYSLKALGVLYSNPFLSVSSDFAVSDTFGWGRDIYANLGLSISPLFTKNTGSLSRPLTISLAADGAGKRFMGRDGVNHGDVFRTAFKVELKGSYNSLLRFSTTLRSQELGGLFDRSSTNFYYRFPARRAGDTSILRLSRISISIDRNAEDNLKITDRLYGYTAFSLNLSKLGLKTPLGISLNGSVRGTTFSEKIILAYPIPIEAWEFYDCAFYGELSISPSIYQFKLRVGYSDNAKKDGIYDFSFSGSVKFDHGRLSVKIFSDKLPDIWSFNISWRLELK